MARRILLYLNILWRQMTYVSESAENGDFVVTNSLMQEHGTAITATITKNKNEYENNSWWPKSHRLHDDSATKSYCCPKGRRLET